MHEFIMVTKALSDENRVRILMFLREGELCLCQIIEILGLSSSTVSKHMSLLVQAGLVRVRKQGRWRYFSLPENASPPYIRKCLDWTVESLAGDGMVVRDSRTLAKISRISVEEFCKTFKARK